jgi:hypothetical protein
MTASSKEIINGLVKPLPPKKTNFYPIANKNLAFVAKKLNHTPRKSLKRQTPMEIFAVLFIEWLGFEFIHVGAPNQSRAIEISSKMIKLLLDGMDRSI